MPKRRKFEDIIGKLGEAEIIRAQGGTVADACRRWMQGPNSNGSQIGTLSFAGVPLNF